MKNKDITSDSSKQLSTQLSTSLWGKYKQGYIPVIPDIKCKSPAEGDLIRRRDPVRLARDLENAGAPAISVVTEAEHYGGNLSLLADIAGEVSVPVLRKDFIRDKNEIDKSIYHGASAVLLISSILERDELFRLIDYTLGKGIEPLVEVHNEDELNEVRELNLPLLGINNRNIIQWEMDNGTVTNTENLAGLVPEGPLIISESSISSAYDIYRAVEAGAHCVLVGTAILKPNDSVEIYHKFSQVRY